MFALLGEIQFDLITYFDGFDSQFDADYAEHALIEGKPRLQWIGDKLDEISIQLSFHAHLRPGAGNSCGSSRPRKHTSHGLGAGQW